MAIIESLGSGDELSKNNTQAYTPTGDYNPATKKYVDDQIAYIKSLIDEIKSSVSL